MYVYSCCGVHVMCTNWLVKWPNRVAESQAQSNQQLNIRLWRPRILCHHWAKVPSRARTHSTKTIIFYNLPVGLGTGLETSASTSKFLPLSDIGK